MSVGVKCPSSAPSAPSLQLQRECIQLRELNKPRFFELFFLALTGGIFIMRCKVFSSLYIIQPRPRALSPADLFGGKAPVGALIGLLERIYQRICSSSTFFMCLSDCCVLAFLCFWESISQTRLDQRALSSPADLRLVRCSEERRQLEP